MGTPKNCKECKYTNCCPAAYYGSDNCKYKYEIIKMIKGGERHE